MPAARVESVQVGRPRWHGTPGSTDPFDRPFATGFWKEPVTGPVAVRVTNLDGDGQADLVNHGGADKAVLAYAAAHYPDWRAELGIADLPHGAFGENLTVAGWVETDVCVGDVWRAGSAVFAVSQPRQPCWKLARRWRLKDLPARVVESGRCGWYLRVLTEGSIAAGDAVELAERPQPEWTVRRAHRVMYSGRKNRDETAALAAVPELSLSWREELLQRL
ncbi:MOSC domain-containing protein [Urbifossiella limnaea]|uniref:6-N-hydroxylaminopurine resistance protein n=1 Tax=Urbifossiella limnaea TaxID=2528023 RepID=A0A517XQ17_9BACT|nr:MOSC domain-containing protein [Urbifossiella limnaea]QDU19605.1 6-N-hydroxylaminopurine resistance protein [Urbifossiella limnaea]